MKVVNEPIAHNKDRAFSAPDFASLILPHTVRLERTSACRGRSIEDAIRDDARDARDRIGLAGERLVTSVLETYTPLDSRRLLCWDTPVQRENVIELDGVSRKARAFLEIKWTVNPERVFAICARQLLNATEIYQVGGGQAPRAIGVIVDCGPLVGKPPYRDTKTLAELVRMIESGTEAFSLCVLPYGEFSGFIASSPYAALLSGEGVRGALRGVRKEQ